MKPQEKLSRVGWGVVITGGKSGPFLGFGRNFFEKRADAVIYAKECRAHKMKAVTRRVRLETI